jgi:DNA-binding transcriptional MerR regulator
MRNDRVFIGRLAKETGVPIKTIRYYEDVGLLPKAPRTESGYRLYGQGTAELLGFVKKAQNLGLSLSEIREILQLSSRGRCPCGHVQQLLRKHLKELEEKMRDWRALRRRIFQALRKPPTSPKQVSGIALCPQIAKLPSPRGKAMRKGGLRP